jgi:hypothetical protein
MARDEADRSGLTRALLVGVALGTVPLLSVGCAQLEQVFQPNPDARPEARDASSVAAQGSEQELCDRALASRARGDVEALIARFPSARCIPDVLSALTPQTLNQLSPATLGLIPPETQRRIPRATAAHLRFPFAQSTESRGGRSSGSY